MLAHLVADLLVAGINEDAQPGGAQFAGDLVGISRRLVGDRGDDRLYRGEPEREMAGVMLDQDPDKALHRAEDRAVQHDRGVSAAILADIDRAKPPRHVEVELHGTALPLSADRVAQVEFELRPMECALTRVERISEIERLDRGFEILLGTVPHRVAADPDWRPVGELDLDVVEAEIAIDRQQQLAAADRLGSYLVLGAEDVRIVLDEAAHPHQPVQGARRLVAVAAAEFGEPQRQFAIAAQPVAEDQDVARAIHRLDREYPLITALGDEHVLAKVLPVPSSLPQAAVQELRPLHLLVT